MAKVITYSRFFPKYHFRVNQPTYFVEKFLRSIYYGKTPLLNNYFEKLNPDFAYISSFRADILHPMDFNPKHTTIRAGKRWKKGDYFSPRVWSGKPYNSKQIIIAPDTLITEVYDIDIYPTNEVMINGKFFGIYGSENFDILALNDGLTREELKAWFNKLPFHGQILCWNENIKY